MSNWTRARNLGLAGVVIGTLWAMGSTFLGGDYEAPERDEDVAGYVEPTNEVTPTVGEAEKPTATGVSLTVPSTQELPELDLKKAPEGLGKQLFEDYLKKIQNDEIEREPCLPMPWDNILAPKFAEISGKYGSQEAVKVALEFMKNYFADERCKTGWAAAKISKGLDSSANIEFYRELTDLVRSEERISYGIGFFELLKEQKLTKEETKDQLDKLCKGTYKSLQEPCLNPSQENYGLICLDELKDSNDNNVCRVIPAYFPKITIELAQEELGEVPKELSIPYNDLEQSQSIDKDKSLSRDEAIKKLVKLEKRFKKDLNELYCKGGEKSLDAAINNWALLAGQVDYAAIRRDIYENLTKCQ